VGSPEATSAEEPPADESIPSPVLLAGMARQAWNVYRATFFPVIWVFLLAFVVLAVLLNLAIYAFDQTDTSRILIFLILVVIGQQIAASLATAVAQVLAADKILGRATRLRDAVREVRSVGSPVLLAAVTSAMLVMLVGLLLPLGASPATSLVQILIGYLFLGPPILLTIVLLETRRFAGSTARFKELLAGEWGRVPMYMLTFALGAAMLQLVATGVSILLVARGVDTVDDLNVWAGLVVLLAGTLVRSVVLPYLSAVWLVAYCDLRARKEKFDRRALIALRTPK
jgi:hypothetical protein